MEQNKPQMKMTQVTKDNHRWLALEAINRDSTITAELDAAISMLRKSREPMHAQKRPRSQTAQVITETCTQ